MRETASCKKFPKLHRFFGASVVHQKIYLFGRRTVTSDNCERRGHLERSCCSCQSVFQLGANLENSLLLRSTERMQGKQGRFTATEDKSNGGVGILGIISKMANNLEKAQIKGRTVWIV